MQTRRLRRKADECGFMFAPINCRYFQAVAALIADADSSARRALLHAVAWFPATRLTPEAMHLATFAWFWIMAAAPALTVRAAIGPANSGGGVLTLLVCS